MFSYQNKIVGIKVSTEQENPDFFDIRLNSELIGQVTGSQIGDQTYFVGSDFTSLKLSDANPVLSGGCPIRINWFFEDDCSVITGSSDLQEDPAGYFFYNLDAAIYNFSIVKSGANPWTLKIGEVDQFVSASYDSGNPFGSYIDYYGEYTLSVSKNFDTTQEPYYFTNLAVVTGINEICFNNIQDNGSGSNLYYEINFYDLSGSYLVNPYVVESGSGNLNISSQQSECVYFNLTYPIPGSVINLFEFPPTFNIDTGNLNQVFTGSGVHLKKDVTFFFDVLDQRLNLLSSDQQFLENPLVGDCSFDILNIDGTVARQNFATGKYSRSLVVSELDNQSIFNTYQKDFGVRCRLSNSFDGSTFTGVFLAYGNLPNILDIVPIYNEFSGQAKATESFGANIILQNDLSFVQMDRYDVYASTGTEPFLHELTYLNPTAQENYLLSQSIDSLDKTYRLNITKGVLQKDTPYYFTVVPYGNFGSGNSFVFGPASFVSVNQNDRTPISTTLLDIYDADLFSRTMYRTGKLCYGRGVIHEFNSGEFTSIKYLVELKDSGNIRRFSELKGVVNETGLALTQETVNDTTTTYQLTGLANGLCGLYASGDNYRHSTYKLQATMF